MSPPKSQTRSNFFHCWPGFGIYSDTMGRSNTMCAAFMSITSDGMTAIPRHWTGSPRDLAQGTLDYMGGTEAVLTRAEADFTAGDYSWVVHIVDQIIWAESDKYVGPPAGGGSPHPYGCGAETQHGSMPTCRRPTSFDTGCPRGIKITRCCAMFSRT